MSRSRKLLGISYAKARPEMAEFDLTFAVDGRASMQVILHFSVAEQMATVFAQLATAVREHQSGTLQAVIAQDVAHCSVERDRWADEVVVRFVSSDGAPYTFALKPETALDIAAKLKTEAEKPHQTGHA